MNERIDGFSQTDIIRKEDDSIIQVSGTKDMQGQENDSHTSSFERKRYLVEIDLEELKQLYLRGESLSRLAIQYNTSKITIKKKLLKINIIIRKDQSTKALNPGVSTQINEKLFIELHSKGATTRDLMKEFNISNDLVIKRIYKRLGLLPNTTNIADKLLDMYQATRNWDTFENLYELYINQEKSILELSELFHADEETIHKALQRLGIKVRTLGEANKLAANKPEGKVARSRISRELWKDSEIREKIITKLKGSHPTMPLDHALHVSEAIKKLYENNAYYEQHKDRVRKLWENPTPAMLENLYDTIKALQTAGSPLKNKHQQSVTTERNLDELSRKATDQWQDEQFLTGQLPILRKKCSDAAKEAWKDPIYREKVMSRKTFTSKLELIVRSILNDLGVKYRKICPGGNEFDLCVEPDQINQNKGMLIEINGLYFHKNDDNNKFIYWKNNLSNHYNFETIWEYEFGAHQSIYNKLIKILQINKTKEINLPDLQLKEISDVDAEWLYNKYHYLAHLRRGQHFGAFLQDRLISACSFSTITRHESAARLNISHLEIRELSRFCINPTIHNSNLASFLLTRYVKMFSEKRPDIKILISFADPFVGHLGTIYKATNWIEDGETNSSYFYIRDGYHYNKRTVYGYARSLSITESEFIEEYGFEKIKTPPKKRFVFKL